MCFQPILRPIWAVLIARMSQKASKVGRFGTKKGEKWARNVFPSCAPGLTGVLKGMFSAHFVAVLDCLETQYVAKTFGRASKA